jgi:hypothetical protein
MRTLSCLTVTTAALLWLLPTATVAQTAAPTEMTVEKSPSPELIGSMTKELGVTPKQAVGGAGAILGLAKTKLKADEFSQVAAAIPGSDGLMKAAPSTGGMPGGLGGVAGLASLAGGFKSLGMSPDMAAKMVPVMSKFMESKGSGAAAKLLAGAVK